MPPRIVATVMVLQRIEGASDREALDGFAFDLRWKDHPIAPRGTSPRRRPVYFGRDQAMASPTFAKRRRVYARKAVI